MPDGELDDVETQTTTVQNPAAAADAIETMSGTVTAFGQTLPAQALKIVTASLSGAIFFFGVLGSYYASTLDEDDDDEYVGPHYILIIILYLLGTVSTVVAMFAPLKGTPLEPHTALIPMVAMGLFWLAFLMAIYGAYFATIDEKGNTWTEYSEMVCVWFGPNSDYCGSFRWTRRFYGTDASRNTMIILLFMLTPGDVANA
jgi:hypothetical protein